MKTKTKHKGKSSLRIVQKFFPQVEEVIDADKSITVEVTEKDDKNSRLKNHAECAMAVACKRKEKADGVIISIRTSYIVKGKTAYRYRVPESTAREVVSFDRKGGFQPGIYKLRQPKGTERLGRDTHDYNRTGVNQRRFSHRTENIRTSLT